MHRKYHPRRNPLKLRAGGPSSGAQASTGLRLSGREPGPLTLANIAYLKDRSLRFQQTLSDLVEMPFGHALQSNDGREAVAVLTATALVGDDVNYATGQPSIGYDEKKWISAYHLVNNNILAWFQQAFPAFPGALGLPTGTKPIPGG